MLKLLISLWLRASVHGLVLTALLLSALPWRKKSHEITSLDKLAPLIHNCYCDDIVVGIDLVHRCAHDNITLAVFDYLVVLLSASRPFDFFILGVSLHLIIRSDFLSGERSCH